MNVIKQDINAPLQVGQEGGGNRSNPDAICALALNTVANIGGAEMSENLFQDICKLLTNPGISPYVKRYCVLRGITINIMLLYCYEKCF